ncbi:MAG TPA: ATP-binding protein [Gemmatimonadota bacterium]|nr:ATP-binding protein [Gemmatimonadota bacterium]
MADEARAGIEDRVTTGVRLLAAGLERADAVETGLSAAGEAGGTAIDDHVDALGRAADARLTLVAPDGRVVADSEFDGAALAALDDHNSRAEVRAARARGEGVSVRYSGSVGSDLLYHARRIENGPWAGSVVRMAVPLTRVGAAQAAARRELLLALVLALGLATTAAALSARRFSRPVTELARMAGRVREGDLSARARVETGDELEELARALETTNDRLVARIAEATAERDRLQGVLDGMVEGVLVTDPAGGIVHANAALQAMFGLQRPAAGRTVIETVRHRDIAEALEEAAAGDAVVSREVTLTWPAERTLTLHAAGLPSGGGVGVLHDITALKRVDRVRRDFVANVSHELRTPLATLAGYAETLTGSAVGANGPDQAEVRETAAVIERNVSRLTSLVADLLELSRLESEGSLPEREPVDAAKLIEDLAGEWRPRAEARDIALAVESSPGLVASVDPRLLRQALANLLENAVRYCPEGSGIRLAAHRDEEGITFTVADDGPGIPYDDQSRIFERFYRVDKARSRATGGTGLGLAIVKHVAEVHGGTASVESQPGDGATFRIRIPQ